MSAIDAIRKREQAKIRPAPEKPKKAKRREPVVVEPEVTEVPDVPSEEPVG